MHIFCDRSFEFSLTIILHFVCVPVSLVQVDLLAASKMSKGPRPIPLGREPSYIPVIPKTSELTEARLLSVDSSTFVASKKDTRAAGISSALATCD